jgi:hypothetical protein
MKVVAQEIEVIAWFSKEGVKPIKFRYQDDNECYITVKIDKVIDRATEKHCGNLALIFNCQSIIDGLEKVYQLKYFVMEMKWLLWKI